ncbi:N,N-dimethylformamidase beta subunit family domain-containing protein [Gimesia maris]|uniref:N,N-dimethylformamidase beta subunit family domain-containing protein n=1 Tax=Gimesia maris TaxID=122 RepID=UPI003A93B08A
MLIGYVSDEDYRALYDVAVEFQSEGQLISTRSTASGAVIADLAPGNYEVILQHRDYCAKRVELKVEPGQVHHFRLLSTKLFGFAWPRCIQSGEASEFRVHSTSEYQLELWRYGKEKEYIRRIGTFDDHAPLANLQITPDGDYTQKGVNWNNVGYRTVTQRQTVTAPDKSGLYMFHLSNQSGQQFTFPWVVSPRTPQSKIAILASDLTWNAYNNFGGRSNYLNPEGLPDTPVVNSRQELRRYLKPSFGAYYVEDYPPLSLERPQPYLHIDLEEQLRDPIYSRMGCGMLHSEWRLLGWMEEQGLDYDYYSETQFHFDQLPLSEYQVLILSSHPEYWSKQMYERLKSWVFESGGRLIYLGGNGLNCEVEFLDEERIVYHNTDCTSWCGVAMDPPIPEKDSTYESRFHARQESEANLLGVVFSFAGIMTGAPYRVVDERHWCFEGTKLKNDDLFGTESQHMRIPGGASGHETDKISPSSPADVQLLAQGTNPDEGGADMIHYQAASGGEVFSVGSICWITSMLVDENISKISRNVIDRFIS